MGKNLLTIRSKVSTNRRLVLFICAGIVIVTAACCLAYIANRNATHKEEISANRMSLKRSSSPIKISSVSKLLSPPPVQPPPSKVVFADPLNGPNRIVTNEFVHWSKSSCPYKSSTWDMTSGTLMVRNGTGYSGIPTLEKTVPCESSTQTNSSIFRLNTRRSDFTNVTVSMDYEAVAHGGGGAPNNVYDGIHVWVGYQDQYSLYIATIYRWDGTIVTKKKVPQNIANCTTPANDGCYYSLAKATARSDITTPNVWHHVDVVYALDANKIVHITTVVDGIKVADVADTDSHGPAYPSGAVGVRGDNTEFYFKNFTVTQL